MRLRGMECRSPSGFAEAFHATKGDLMIWSIQAAEHLEFCPRRHAESHEFDSQN